MAVDASFPPEPTYGVQVTDGERSELVQGKHIIIATGSVPRQLPGAAVDNEPDSGQRGCARDCRSAAQARCRRSRGDRPRDGERVEATRL